MTILWKKRGIIIKEIERKYNLYMLTDNLGSILK